MDGEKMKSRATFSTLPGDCPTTTASSRVKTITLVVMSIIILVPTMAGFAMKFIEFVHTFRERSDGIFAITPITNYLLASIGFFCMLLWATLNGMFHDIEQPKHQMLETERQLDEAAAGGDTPVTVT
jgi:hypothetical protein